MGMDRTISNFIRALRNADVRVSTAETLDAISAVELVGYSDKSNFKAFSVDGAAENRRRKSHLRRLFRSILPFSRRAR